MKTFNCILNYLYTCIECEIEAKNKAEAKKIFFEEIAENEGKAFAHRAELYGKYDIEEI
jgi:hypothetical protein